MRSDKNTLHDGYFFLPILRPSTNIHAIEKQSPDKRRLCFTNNIVTERKLGGILLGCYPDCKILAAHCRRPWPTPGPCTQRDTAGGRAPITASVPRTDGKARSKSLSSADELKNEYVCSIQVSKPQGVRQVRVFPFFSPFIPTLGTSS